MADLRSRRAFLVLAGSALAAGLAACTSKTVARSGASSTASDPPSASLHRSSAAPSTSAWASSATPRPTPTPTPVATGRPISVSLLNADGDVRGVGMPLIAYFGVAPTDGRAFDAATRVTVNGAPAHGNWYFAPSTRADAALEAHWRPQTYWPAHAKIHLDLPVAGLSAGPGLVYANNLTLDFSTGVAYRGTVDAATLVMTVTADGKPFGRFPVSLGAADTPTARGIKVIMEKGRDISMRGPDYYDAHVEFTQRLTYGGEYLHSAPWNIANIGQRSTSNGCTNLLPADAQRLFDTFSIGDVFTYPNANGPAMTLGAGYGDWNVPWATWQTGGALTI